LVINPSKRNSSQIAVGILSLVAAAGLALLLGWLAVDLAVRLTDTFEVIATIVGWILWPLRI
jgi:type VI protein secretion system component VasF